MARIKRLAFGGIVIAIVAALFLSVGGCAKRPGAATPDAATKKTLGLAYDQIMNGLTTYFRMEPAERVAGEYNYQGRAAAGAAMLQITGAKSDVSFAALMLYTDRDTSGANAEMLARFVGNCFPGWRDGVDWTGQAIRQALVSRKPVLKKVGERVIGVTVYPTVHGVAVEVRPL